MSECQVQERSSYVFLLMRFADTLGIGSGAG